MMIDIKDCDFNNAYFHFSKKTNIDSILNNGLFPSIGTASQLVEDCPNVSVSQGGKGIMGIINSFIYVFSTKIKISEIPEEYKKYFIEILDFNSDGPINKDIIYRAMIRKLQDEVYFQIELNEKQLEQAKIGGLTGFDIKLPMPIDKTKIKIITDSNHNVLSAYDVAFYIYQKTRNIDVFRFFHGDFFSMFETGKQNAIVDFNSDYGGKKR